MADRRNGTNDRLVRRARNTVTDDSQILEADKHLIGKQTVITQADMSKLNVAAAGANYQTLRQADHLKRTCDSIGAKEIEAMMKDYEVESALGVLVAAATAKEGQVVSCVTDEDDLDYAMASMLTDYIMEVISNMQPNLKALQRVMLESALAYGSSVAEIQKSAIGYGDFQGLTTIDIVRTTNLSETSLVLDKFDRIVGILPNVNNRSYPVDSFIPFIEAGKEEQLLKSVLPRHKFVVMTWNEGAGDPRGKSILRAAYEPWLCKWDAAYMMKIWLEKFSSASIIGNLPENASPTCEEDEDGNLINCDDPAADFLMMLQQFQSNSAIAIPHDANVNIVQAAGDVQSFLTVIAWADKAITRGILKQNLATQEGEHQARAASETHKDILSLYILCLKALISETFERDLFRPLIERHFPKHAHLTPQYDLGLGSGFPLTAQDIAALITVGFIDPSQYADLDKRLDLPTREAGDAGSADVPRRGFARVGRNSLSERISEQAGIRSSM